MKALEKTGWAAFAFFLFFSCTTYRVENNPADASENFQKEILRLVNNYRTKGYKNYPPVAPVKWNNRLEAAAKAHCNYMSSKNVLSHKGRNGSDPGVRIKAAGYNWSSFRENIAMGQQSAREVMGTWINSPSHSRNIMNPNVTEMGVAKTGRYWTQVFAQK